MLNKRFFGLSLLILIVCFPISRVIGQDETHIKKFVVLGNSLSLHQITNFWWGAWGMAATQRDSDFCHVLGNLITTWQNENCSFSVYNISDWERGHNSDRELKKVLNLLDGDEDLVVVRVGECVNSFDTYQTDMERLIDSVRLRSKNAQVVVSGNFWPHYLRECGQQDACLSRHCIWCPLKQLWAKENIGTVDDEVYGDDSIWHKISDGGGIAQGVANHPNNRGHKLIAQNLFDSIIIHFKNTTAIQMVCNEPQKEKAVEYFDLQGRRVERPEQRGVYIRCVIYENGSRKSRKIVYSDN